MRLNLPALTVSAALCLAGMTTLAPAAPKSTDSSDSSGSLLSRIFGQSTSETPVAKPAKRAQGKHAAKKVAAKNVAKPEQPDNAAVAEAVRDFLKNNQSLLRTAIIDVLRGDADIQKMVAAPADKSTAPQTPAAPPQAAPTDQVRVEEIVRNYLLLHPEVLKEANGELGQPQALAEAEKHRVAIKENSEVLYNSPRQVVLGNPRGDVTFVEFFDYNCGYCKKALSDMMTLIKSDPKLKVVLKEFPVLGKGSAEAAQVAVAVRMQDKTGKKYLEFHQKLLLARAPADRDRALAVAKEIGLDMARLEKDMASEEARVSIEESLKLASDLGLNGTPSYVVGPEVVVGAVGLDVLRERVNTARSGKAVCWAGKAQFLRKKLCCEIAASAPNALGRLRFVCPAPDQCVSVSDLSESDFGSGSDFGDTGCSGCAGVTRRASMTGSSIEISLSSRFNVNWILPPTPMRSSSSVHSGTRCTGLPFTATITSPIVPASVLTPLSPAFPAGEFGNTRMTMMPVTPRRVATDSAAATMPTPGVGTRPFWISSGTTRLTMSTGMAKPMPAFCPDFE